MQTSEVETESPRDLWDEDADQHPTSQGDQAGVNVGEEWQDDKATE